MSSKGPPCAAFSLWGHTAPYHTGFDSVMFLLCRLTGTVRQRFWFVAMSKQTLCKYGCGGTSRSGASTTCSEAAWQQGGMTENPGAKDVGRPR